MAISLKNFSIRRLTYDSDEEANIDQLSRKTISAPKELHEFFKYNGVENNTYCLIENCHKCFTNYYNGMLRRHLEDAHSEYIQLNPVKASTRKKKA